MIIGRQTRLWWRVITSYSIHYTKLYDDEVPVLTNVAVLGAKGESVDEFRPGGEAPAAVEAPVAVA